jgi:restriction endonuclease S subunit
MPKSHVNITRQNFANTLLPIARFAEQAAIVGQVRALMSTCRALEAQIEQVNSYAALLLQGGFKEAFVSGS